MATVTKPMALDESMNTTESTSRNIADVLAQELSGIASAITGGSDKANKTDIATVEPTNTASRAYSVGELVYVNGNLYKVITAITSGATFTVGTNIQSTNVSGTVKDALDGLTSDIVAQDFNTTKSIGANSSDVFTISNFTKAGYTLGSIVCETSHTKIFVSYNGLSGSTGYFSILNPTDVARTDEPIRLHVLWVKS